MKKGDRSLEVTVNYATAKVIVPSGAKYSAVILPGNLPKRVIEVRHSLPPSNIRHSAFGTFRILRYYCDLYRSLLRLKKKEHPRRDISLFEIGKSLFLG
jgi:hypothetical protein